MGAALGSRSFTEEYVTSKVNSWVKEIEKLTTFASSQPHAAYAAFTHGLSGKWTHLARTVPGTSDLLQPLEEVIRHRFIPALIGRTAISDVERELLSLPTHLGGLGIMNPSEVTISQYTSSMKITAPLVTLIIQQSTEYTHTTKLEQHRAITETKSNRRQIQSRKAASLAPRLPNDLRHAVEIAKEKRCLKLANNLTNQGAWFCPS